MVPALFVSEIAARNIIDIRDARYCPVQLRVIPLLFILEPDVRRQLHA